MTPHCITATRPGGRLAAPAWAEFYQHGLARGRATAPAGSRRRASCHAQIDADNGLLAE